MTSTALATEHRAASGTIIASVRAAYLRRVRDEAPQLGVCIVADDGTSAQAVSTWVELRDDRIGRAPEWSAFENVLRELPGTGLGRDVDSVEVLLADLLAGADVADESSYQIAGLSAVRVALLGLLDATHGTTEGKVGDADSAPWSPGVWRSTDLDDYCRQILPRLGRYTCAPGPDASPDDRARQVNAYPDGPYIGRLPGKATVSHLLEREALRRGMNSTRFPKGTFVLSDGASKVSFTWGRPPLARGVSPTLSPSKSADRKRLETTGVPTTRDAPPGTRYHVAVVDGQAVAAIAVEPVAIVGNGIDTIFDLVAHSRGIRSLNPHLRTQDIEVGEEFTAELAEQGLTLASVLEKGRRCRVPGGYDTREVGTELHPSVREAARRTVESVPGLTFGVVTMVLDDHGTAIQDQRGGVVGLSTHNFLDALNYPMLGEPADVVGMIFESCCAAHGLDASDRRADELSVRIVIRGNVSEGRYSRRLVQNARQLGVTGVVRQKRTGVVADLHGAAEAVSALVYLAAAGLSRVAPTSVATEHIRHRTYSDFDVAVSRSAQLKRFVRRLLRVTPRRG